MNKIIWIFLAFLSGAFLPIQAGLNAKLGRAVGNPIYAALLSFLVGSLAILLYILFTRQTFSWQGLKEAPGHVWLGGLMGAFYVTVIVLAFPQLGPGLTFGLIVAGQMIVSMILEHNNILVAQATPVNAMKLLGVALIIGGVIILRKY